ncbi:MULTISPECIES: M4 family metallopeptidase [unclassified Kitasatospora]|uniref:M4 family metallopeptidase n=1 Tax=unclassified Kitasatospora TaxID=2633591 RepID=UPI00071112F7|nr:MULTISPECIES: M4 family metallopeptidase [unclassified Kitasatospora]KQV14410.1 peptidase M4 [Kitasatospora sp. Root107]KRB66238.1 peptidase M4 [Kitasatospora sp. Root187]
MSRYTHARVTMAALAATTALVVTALPTMAQAAPQAPAPVSQAAAGKAQLLSDAGQKGAGLVQALGLSGQEKLIAKDVVVDADGSRHLRYERTYGGLPVLGGDMVVHQTAGGVTKGLDRASTASLAGVSTTPALAAPKAQAAALAAEQGSSLDTAPRLVVWAAGNAPTLAWETVVSGVEADGTPMRTHVVTDAQSGVVLHKFEGIQKGTGQGVFVGNVTIGTTLSGSTYQMKDAPRGGMYTTNMNNGTSGNGTLFTKATDAWGNGLASNKESAAVDAHFGAAATWDYYKNTFGRNGIRNDGVGAFSRVHYGSNYVNAFWDDQCFCMTYGDGSGNNAPLTALDVAGHEMTHGVTSNTANLTYSGESGGLNEATSDIFGTMVEFNANLAADVPDYLIGEEININGDGTPLRYMDKPSKDGSSKDAWYSGIGGVDVHYSSGPANHFFYLLSEGSGAKVINGVSYNSPTTNNITVTGIGRDKAAAIWYRALTVYMTSSTNYAQARTATENAAKDLYGAGSAEVIAVGTAWAGVSVGSVPPNPGAVTVTSPGNQSTKINTAVSLQVNASGGTAPRTFTATGLPAGLSISSSGLITGTPTALGTSNVTVTAKDAVNATGSASFTWTVTDTTSTCTPAQLLGNAGFESGATVWTTTSGVVDNGTSKPARTGSYKAWLNGYGSAHTDSASQTVSIPVGCKATLGFYLRIDTAETGTTAYDKLTVTVNGTALKTYSNVDKTATYTLRTFDLSAYAGQTVTLKFNGVEDSSLATSFLIDDTSITTS